MEWKQQFISAMPNFLGERAFLFLNGQWLGILAIVLASLLIEKVIKSYLNFFTRKILHRRNLLFSKEKQKRIYPSLMAIIFAICWLIGVPLLEFSSEISDTLLRVGKVILTTGIVVIVFHLVDIFAHYYEETASETESKFDDILVPLIRKVGKTVVVILGIAIIGESLTLNMKSLIAGLGIGGLAFALAAKDTLGNIFGSLTVLMDRPFHIGDWVKVGSSGIEGTVEEVGLRSTRIRTFYDSLVTLPNGQLTNVHIDNYGMRKYRAYYTTLGVQYDTPAAKIEAFCEGIREIIRNHPLTRKDYFQVYFNHFSSSSLDVLLYVMWEVPSWAKELEERHKLLSDILKLGEELDVRFAFPTQTLHMYKEEASPYKEDSAPPREAGKAASAKILSHQH